MVPSNPSVEDMRKVVCSSMRPPISERWNSEPVRVWCSWCACGGGGGGGGDGPVIVVVVMVVVVMMVDLWWW